MHQSRRMPFRRNWFLPAKAGWRHAGIICAVAAITLAGCSDTSRNYQSRPFFLPEKDVMTHGRKTWFDNLLETDPGHVRYLVSATYQTHPPRRIAVLPFCNRVSGNYMLDGIALTWRNKLERDEWAWTNANRIRREVTGSLAEREFAVVPLPAVDAVLSYRGVNSCRKLKAVSPEELGRWLDADTVVYGEVLDYDAFYYFLAAGWRIGAKIRVVSTRDGHDFFSARDTRYAVDLCPAFDPIDILLNSATTTASLRDVVLARAEWEVVREIMLRLPIAKDNVSRLRETAVYEQRAMDSDRADASSMLAPPAQLNVSRSGFYQDDSYPPVAILPTRLEVPALRH